MAILGTMTQAMIDAMLAKKINLRVNGVYRSVGLVYKTGDIVSFYGSGSLDLINAFTLNTTYTQLTPLGNRVLEVVLTSETPFSMVVTSTIGVAPSITSLVTSGIVDVRNLGLKYYRNNVEYFYLSEGEIGSVLRLDVDPIYPDKYIDKIVITYTGNPTTPWAITPDGKSASYTVQYSGVTVNYAVITMGEGEPEPIPEPDPDMILTQSEIDTYINGSFFISGVVGVVGKVYKKGNQLKYETSLKDWTVNSVTLVDGSLPFTRVGTTNNFILTYPYDYSDKGVYAIVNGQFKIYYVNELDIATVESNNAKMFINGVLAKTGDVIANGDSITIVANSGYKFFYNSTDRFSVYVPYQIVTASDDMRTGSFTLKDVRDRIYPQVETIVVTPDDVVGINNIYLVDDSEVKTLISTNWIDDTAPLNPIEIGNQIISVLSLPFNIPNDLIGIDDTIRLGGYNTDLAATTLIDDEITIDLGSIFIPKIKDNLLDYVNTVVTVNLPYVERIFIDVTDAINRTLKIEYVINLYNSITTVNIYSDSRLIISNTVDLNFRVPFGDVETIPSGYNSQDVSVLKNNDIRNAYVEVIRNGVVLENGLFTIPIIDESVLSSVSGYTEIEQIDLKMVGNSDDKEMIINLLKNGVIIND